MPGYAKEPRRGGSPPGVVTETERLYSMGSSMPPPELRDTGYARRVTREDAVIPQAYPLFCAVMTVERVPELFRKPRLVLGWTDCGCSLIHSDREDSGTEYRCTEMVPVLAGPGSQIGLCRSSSLKIWEVAAIGPNPSAAEESSRQEARRLWSELRAEDAEMEAS